MICRPKPIIESYLGMQTWVTYDHDDLNLKLVHYFAATLLLLIALVHHVNKKECSLYRRYLFFYSINTALFAACRGVFDVGRMLLFTAALHNSGEWALWWVITHKEAEVKTRIFFSNAWIWIISVLVFTIPNLFVAANFEEASGAMCDFFMLITFIYRYKHAENEVQSQAFLWGIVATATHFGTILSLVAIIFKIVPTYMEIYLEALSLISVYFAFASHNKVAEYWEQDLLENHDPKTSISKNIPQPIVIRIFIVSAIAGIGGIVMANLIPICGTIATGGKADL